MNTALIATISSG